MKIAFDIDDTLMKFDHEWKLQTPDYELIAVLRWFVANGDDVIVWSGGGLDYAKRTIEKLGLHGVRAIEKGSILADIAFDDSALAQMGIANVRVRREDKKE